MNKESDKMIKQFTENYYSEMINEIQAQKLEPVNEKKIENRQSLSVQALSEKELKQIENKL